MINNIRNFSIIAHVDHGKSTLSDRIIQICGGLNKREMLNQVLDTMDLERERGITIKAQNVTLNYKSLENKIYQLNFIDTPGHVDFSYEVSRSLSASEGALLLIDASQGIEAQTLANCYTAIKMGVKILPVLNKIDLPSANPDKIEKDIKDIIGIDTKNIVRCSAKTGVGVCNVLEQLVKKIPHPNQNLLESLQALIIDSWFDNYLGVISLVRVKNGTLIKGSKIKIMSTGKSYNINKLGLFTPKRIDCKILNCGEIGWLSYAIKDVNAAPVGDTITLAKNPAKSPLPGFKKIKPLIYSSLFTINSNDYKSFNNALGKLSLNDSSLFYEPENSIALGPGFRCGFLGLLHMEIIQERLEREYNLNIITTAPSVIYEILTNKNKIIYIDNPYKLSLIKTIIEIREPIAICNILSPDIYLGNIISLCIEKRGIQISMKYHNNYVLLVYEIPMAEVILDFFDRLKSVSKGYASLDYNFKYFKKSDMVKIDISINNDKINVLSSISHKEFSKHRGKEFINKLKNIIPRQQFDIIIRASIGKHIIAKATIKQLRKNVIAKCYGGDVTRKKKLIKKQKEGKKRMKRIGNIDLPQEAFLMILNSNKNKK